MKNCKPRHIILAICAAMFLYQLWHIASIRASEKNLEQDAAAWVAKVNQRNSASYIVPILLKSVFDGFTFGRFADEGIFTEYKKETRFDEKAIQTHARLLTAHSQNLAELRSAALLRNWSLAVGLIILAYSYVAKKAKVRKGGSVQNAVNETPRE
jgi:hypothetical protein